MGTSINIVILDNHALFRAGLKSLLELEPYFAVVAEVGSVEECIDAFCKISTIDVLLLDIGLKDRNGLEAIESIRAIQPQVKILVLSVHPASIYAVRALEAEADGYLTKGQETTDRQELVKAIKTVSSGQKYFVHEAQHEIFMAAVGERTALAHDALSPRELEILLLTAQGRSSADIAQSLRIGASTVDSYKRRILRKLDLESVKNIPYYAFQHNLISSET